jgi:hypothetical protein
MAEVADAPWTMDSEEEAELRVKPIVVVAPPVGQALTKAFASTEPRPVARL